MGSNYLMRKIKIIMNYIKGIYDSFSKQLFLEYRSKLLKSHSKLFEKTFYELKEKGELPERVQIKSVTPEKCVLILPTKIKGEEKLNDGDRIENIPPEVHELVSSLIEKFTDKALEAEFENVEFIPLSGYSIEELKKDITSSIKEKRDFCLIDTYENYKMFNKREINSIRQYLAPFNSDEWANIALIINSENLVELKKLKKKLIFTEWP